MESDCDLFPPSLDSVVSSRSSRVFDKNFHFQKGWSQPLDYGIFCGLLCWNSDPINCNDLQSDAGGEKKLQLNCTLNFDLSLRREKRMWKKSCNKLICIQMQMHGNHNLKYMKYNIHHLLRMKHMIHVLSMYILSTGDLSPDFTSPSIINRASQGSGGLPKNLLYILCLVMLIVTIYL